MNFHSEWFLARSSCQCSSAHLLNTHHFQYVFFPVRIIRRSEQNQSVCCIKTVHSVHPHAFTQQSLMTDSHRALGSRLLCCLLCCCVAQIYNAGGSVSMALHVQGSLVFPSMTDRLSEFSCETRALFPLGDIHQWLWINSMHCKVCVCVWAREKRRQLRMPTIVILLNSQNCTTYISTNARFQPMPWTALLLPECILNKHGCPFFSLPWREFAAPIYMYVYIFCIRWAKWHMNAQDSVTVVVANEVQYISMLLCAARLASTHHRSDIISDTCCINACYECVHTHTASNHTARALSVNCDCFARQPTWNNHFENEKRWHTGTGRNVSLEIFRCNSIAWLFFILVNALLNAYIHVYMNMHRFLNFACRWDAEFTNTQWAQYTENAYRLHSQLWTEMHGFRLIAMLIPKMVSY